MANAPVGVVSIMEAPPPVRLGFRPAHGRILPNFLPSMHREIEVVERPNHRLHPAIEGLPGVEYPVAIAQEGAQAGVLVVIHGGTEILVEGGPERGIPWKLPVHALPV